MRVVTNVSAKWLQLDLFFCYYRVIAVLFMSLLVSIKSPKSLQAEIETIHRKKRV